MADNVTIPASGTGTATPVIATDDVAGVQFQKVKLDLGGDGATNPAPVGGGTESGVLRVTIASDSTGVLSVDDNGGALTVDGTVTANLAAGSNNIGDVDVLSIAAGTNYIGKVRITDGSLDSSLVDETGSSAVDALAVGGGTPHDSVDSGNPVKVGWKAASALPTAVASGDRANGISDLWGRQMVTHIAPAQQIHTNKNYTTQQTGSDVIDPSASKKIAVTSVVIGTYGTTSGRIILWFGDNADTTFTQDTDQVLFAGSFAPSATQKPGVVLTFPVPVFCTTADRELHVTTDAAISFDLTIESYEW